MVYLPEFKCAPLLKLLDIQNNSDKLGMLASSLCLIHCIATPFLFLAHTASHAADHHVSKPLWWKSMDFIFLALSFIAVYRSTQTTSRPIMKYLFWSLWGILFASILNEKLELIHLGESIIYVVTLSLVALHFYNQKYCKCDDEKCCEN